MHYHGIVDSLHNFLMTFQIDNTLVIGITRIINVCSTYYDYPPQCTYLRKGNEKSLPLINFL